LAKQIREDLETPTANFNARQTHHKKNFQAAIEKKFRTKQQQEGHVTQTGEKYKSDCLRINSYTAQASLMQGKELEKIHTKLERAQQTVQANERDFANFAKNLRITVAEWEQDWKVFCDSCQDQEEERLEFMKDTMWAYANAVSTVCVSDDEVSMVLIYPTINTNSLYSLVRKCDSPLNKWSLRRTWRTLYATMALVMLSPTLLPLSTTAAPKPSPLAPHGSPLDQPSFFDRLRELHHSGSPHRHQKSHSSTPPVLVPLERKEQRTPREIHYHHLGHRAQAMEVIVGTHR